MSSVRQATNQTYLCDNSEERLVGILVQGVERYDVVFGKVMHLLHVIGD